MQQSVRQPSAAESCEKIDRRRRKSDVSRSARGKNILLEAIEELRKRTTAESATFLVKLKAHRGESANEEADIQADEVISSKCVPTEWRDRTNRAVLIE